MLVLRQRKRVHDRLEEAIGTVAKAGRELAGLEAAAAQLNADKSEVEAVTVTELQTSEVSSNAGCSCSFNLLCV